MGTRRQHHLRRRNRPPHIYLLRNTRQHVLARNPFAKECVPAIDADVGILTSLSPSCDDHEECIPYESSGKGGICVDAIARNLHDDELEDDEEDTIFAGDYWYYSCVPSTDDVICDDNFLQQSGFNTCDEYWDQTIVNCIMCSECRCYAFDYAYLEDGSSYYWGCIRNYDSSSGYSQVCWQATYGDADDEWVDDCKFYLDGKQCDCVVKLCTDISGKNQRIDVDCSAITPFNNIKYGGCYDEDHESFPGSAVCFDGPKPDPLLFQQLLLKPNEEATQPQPPNLRSSDGEDGLSAGAIVGIVVGSEAALAIMIAAMVFLTKDRRRGRLATAPAERK